MSVANKLLVTLIVVCVYIPDANALSLKLHSLQSRQLVSEPYRFTLQLVTETGTTVFLAEALFEWETTIKVGAETMECRHLYFGFAKPTEINWKELKPEDSMTIFIPNDLSCFCSKEELTKGNCLEWWQKPGIYEFTVRFTQTLPQDLDQKPKGVVFEGEIESNSVTIEVMQPTGIDLEALEWSKENRTIPTSHQLIQRYKTSRYAAWAVFQKFQGFASSDFRMIMNSIESGDYLKRELWVPEDDGIGQHPISGLDAIFWKRNWFNLILQHHPGLPFAEELKLMLALDDLALRNYDAASESLQALAQSGTTDMKKKAALCLSIAKSKGWINDSK